MVNIFHAWWQSLYYFSYKKFPSFITKSFFIFSKAIFLVVIQFWWLFAIELVIGFLFKDLLSHEFVKEAAKGMPVNFSQSIIFLVTVIIWFVINALLFLSVCAGKKKVTAFYYQIGIFRYAQLQLFFSFIFLIFFLFIQGLGIRLIPSMPWPVFMFFRLAGVMIIFYWLDSKYYFSDLFKSIERGINGFFYNFPFFLIMIVMIVVFHVGINALFVYFLRDGDVELQKLISVSITPLFAEKISETKLSYFFYSGFKYVKFLFEYFIISMIFCLYSDKKRVHYTDRYLV